MELSSSTILGASEKTGLYYPQGPRSKFLSGEGTEAKLDEIKLLIFFHIFSDVAIRSQNSPSLN